MADPFVVRSSIWDPLLQRLKDARVDTVHTVSVDLLARPVELLSLMASEAPAALADDALAADRLRMLLFLAAPFADYVEEASRIRKADPVVTAPYEPSVLDHAALALLGLAATRVEPPHCRGLLVDTVHGLAVAAAPVEVLGRLVPHLPGADGIAVVLDTLYLLRGPENASRASRLRPFAADPVERGRWECLWHLFKSDLPEAIRDAVDWRFHLKKSLPWEGGESLPWEGGESWRIKEVHPVPNAPSELLVRGDFAPLLSGGGLRPGLVVVFVPPDDSPLECEVVAAGNSELRVRMPRPASSGWIGFSDSDQAVRANQFRRKLKETLPGSVRRLGCVREDDVKRVLEFIHDVGAPDPLRPGKWLARPPRTAFNRIEKPPADGEARKWTPVAVEPRGEPVQITSVRVLQGEREERFCLGQPLDVDVLLDAPVQRVSLALDEGAGAKVSPIVVDAKGPAQQHFVLSIPSDRCRDGMALTVSVDGNEQRSAGRKTLGPLELGELREARIVLLRPQVLCSGGPVFERFDWIRGVLGYVGALLGLRPVIKELPWVDDELAVLTTPLNSAEDARIPLLLETLAHRAMVTPGLEAATWLCVPPLPSSCKKDEESPSGASAEVDFLKGFAEAKRLPSYDERRQNKASFRKLLERGDAFHRYEPAEGARAVAVATWPALPELLEKLYGEKGEPVRVAPTLRLRLLGTLREDSVSLESVQEEERARGPGAPLGSGVTVATLDDSGRELFVDEVRCLRRERPALLAALPPISPIVKAVELRLGRKRVLARVERVEAESEVKQANLGDVAKYGRREFTWRYWHSRNARPALSLSLGAEDHQTEVLRIDPCDKPTQLHLSRYGSANKVELLASDGWNRKARPVDGVPVHENPDPVSIRRLPDGRWFAGLPSDERWLADSKSGNGIRIKWYLNNEVVRGDETPRVLKLPPEARGILRLEVERGEMRNPIFDERMISEA